jgi:enoyl-CoA hydratase
VQGYCIMGGLMLAWCRDLIIGADDALFADRAVRWDGSHVQYFNMPWDLGPRKAKEYLFTGDYIDAATARELGLVNRVVPRAELAEATLELAGRIALQDPFALKLAKASVNETMDIQGQRRALEAAFKNYMLTIPHRQALGPTARPRQGGEGPDQDAGREVRGRHGRVTGNPTSPRAAQSQQVRSLRERIGP